MSFPHFISENNRTEQSHLQHAIDTQEQPEMQIERQKTDEPMMHTPIRSNNKGPDGIDLGTGPSLAQRTEDFQNSEVGHNTSDQMFGAVDEGVDGKVDVVRVDSQRKTEFRPRTSQGGAAIEEVEAIKIDMANKSAEQEGTSLYDKQIDDELNKAQAKETHESQLYISNELLNFQPQGSQALPKSINLTDRGQNSPKLMAARKDNESKDDPDQIVYQGNEYLETDAPLMTDRQNDMVVRQDDIIFEDAGSQQYIEDTLDKIQTLQKKTSLRKSALDISIKEGISNLMNKHRKKREFKVRWCDAFCYKRLIFAFANGVAGASYAFIVGKLVQSLNPYADQQEDTWDTISDIMYNILIISGVMLVLGYLQAVTLQKVATNINHAMGRQLIKTLIAQECQYYEQLDIENLPKEILTKFTLMNEHFSDRLGKVYFACGAIFGSLALSVYMSPSFTLALLLCAPSLACCLGFLSHFVFQESDGQIEECKKVMSDLAIESFDAYDCIRALSEENSTIAKFKKLQESTWQQSVDSKKSAGMRPVVYLSLLVSFAAYAWLVTGLFEEGNWSHCRKLDCDEPITVTDCYICIEAFIFIMIVTPMLLSQLKAIRYAKKEFASLVRFLDREPQICTIEEEDGNKVLPISQITWSRGIYFTNVSFRRPSALVSQEDALQNVTFDIVSGQLTALVGADETDKEAIIHLLIRMYDPDSGDIKFGSFNDMKSLRLETYRSQVAYIGSEPQILKGSVISNILLGNQNATKSQVLEAIKIANADFIEFDAQIGFDNHGQRYTLSQLHRLAMVRALVCQPKLILIEDVSSQLDQKDMESYNKAISNILNHAKQNKITLIIATDRLTCVQDCDQLLYMESPSSVLEAGLGTQEYDDIYEILYNKLNKDQSDITTEQSSLTGDEIEQNEQQIQAALRTDCPQEIKSQKKRGRKVGAKAYSSEFTRVLNFNQQSWRTIIAYPLILLSSCCYPIIAYAYIKLQILYLSYEHLPTNENSIEFELLDADYFEEKFILFALLAGALVASVILQSLTWTILAPVNAQIELSLRLKLLRAAFRLSESHVMAQKDSLTNTVINETSQLSDAAIHSTFTVFEVKCTFLASIIFSATICWRSTVILMFMGPVVIYSMKSFQRYIFGTVNSGTGNKTKALQAMLSDLVKNYKLLSLMNPENLGPMNVKFERLFEKQASPEIQNSRSRGCRMGLAQAGRLLFLLIAFVFCYEALIVYLEIPSEDVLITIILLLLCFTLIGLKLGSLPLDETTEQEAKNIFSIIDSVELRPQQDTRKQEIRFGSIFFQNITVGDELREITVEVPVKQKSGILQPKNGTVAKTIANLLLRKTEVDQGAILIDGIDIHMFSLKELRNQVLYLNEDSKIFNISIRDNIAVGCKGASNEQIYRAALQAQALNFIEEPILDQNARLNKIQREIEENLQTIKKSYPEFQELSQILIDVKLSADVLQMLNDVLRFADITALNKISQSIRGFVKFTSEIMLAPQTKNITWIDHVMKFEWNIEVQEALENNRLYFNEQVQTQISTMFNRNIGRFDPQLVIEDLKTMLNTESQEHNEFLQSVIISGKISQFIANSRTNFHLQQRQRREDLFKSLVDVRRSHDGEFRLSPGFQKLCGKNGCNLTKSQRKRIAIARAILMNPKIVIFDNFSIGLEPIGRIQVQNAMHKLAQDRTTILISPLNSQLSQCDQIIVIGEAGASIETGTFGELKQDPDNLFNQIRKEK